MAKIKLKTRRAALKRFRKATANGKIKRSIRNHGHFLSKKGHHQVRKLQGTTYVASDNFDMINKLVPAHGAKRKRTKFLRRLAEVAKLAKQQSNA